MTLNIGKFLVVWLLTTAPVSLAHEIRPALLSIKQTSELQYRAIFKQPQVQGRFLNLTVETNCDATSTAARTRLSVLQQSFTLACTEAINTIEILGLKNTLIDTLITLDNLDGRKQTFLVNGREPRVTITGGASTPVYFMLGMEHLFFGFDHIVFVLLLLYWFSGWRNLVKVITSFTVAHSITLGLSALNVVSVAQRPVEALIALSIVLLAAETLREGDSLIHQKPWVMTFVFGLLHGLGFAGALAAIGLPEDSVLMALLLFNVGIEAGQLAIIACALALIFALRHFDLRIKRSLITLPVYLIGGLATYWFIDRTLQVLS